MRRTTADCTRRSLIGGLSAIAGLAVFGCKPRQAEQPAEPERVRGPTQVAPPTAAAMTVYRDPSCGCCEAWADIARKAGYQVSLVDHPDMPAIKRQQGVPEELLSCHTAVASGYSIEGHVPLEDVARLLEERPPKLRGIGVAGMPLGSPGMEMPDGTSQPFQVMAFDSAGRRMT